MSHTRSDSKERFTTRVSDYVAGRPTYPAALIDELSRRTGFDASWSVADIGAGTGISTQLFLANGNAVTCVEPNAAMRDVAASLLAGNPALRQLSGSAEETGLGDASTDLVLAAQAFHWFEPAGFARECRRVLTARGFVALVWNNKLVNSTPFIRDYESLSHEYALDLDVVAGKWKMSTETAPRWFTPASYQTFALRNDQRCDFETLAARLTSSSYMPPRGHDRYEPMLAALKRLFDHHAVHGYVTIPHETRVYLGRPEENQ